MRLKTLHLVAAGALTSMGCLASLDEEQLENSTLVCATDAECPSGQECDPRSGFCVAQIVEEAPSVELDVAANARPARQLPFTITVSDRDTLLGNDEDVTFDLRYWLEDGPSDGCAMALRGDTSGEADDGCAPLVDPAIPVSAPVEGACYRAIWDLTQSDPQSGCVIELEAIDTVEDGVPDLEVARFQPGVLLGVAATDGSGLSSPVEQAGPIDIGNEAPTLELSFPPAEGFDTGTIAGNGTLSFTLTDSSQDSVEVRFRFRLEADGTPSDRRAGRLPALQGSTTNLTADAPDSTALTERIVVWETARPLTAVDGDETGGIGRDNQDNVTIVAWTVERTLDGLETYGPFIERTVNIRNQTTPIVTSVSANGSASDVSSNLVYIDYTIVDEQSDPADVRVQYQLGAGSPLLNATPFPSPLHSGRYDLATTTSEGTPITHTFVWDVGSDLREPFERVFVAVTAADENSGQSGPTSRTELSFAAGLPLSENTAARFDLVDSESFAARTNRFGIHLGDFNDDDILDVVNDRNQFSLGQGGGLFSASVEEGSDPQGPDRFNPVARVADFDDDGFDDTVQTATNNGIYLSWGGPSGLEYDGNELSVPPSRQASLAAGDIVGDSKPDFMAAGNATISIYESLGDRIYAAASNPTQSVSICPDGASCFDVFAVNIGDFDGDGNGDIAGIVATTPPSSQVGTTLFDAAVFVLLGQRSDGGIRSFGEPTFIGSATGETNELFVVGLAGATGDLDAAPGDELIIADRIDSGFSRLRVFSYNSTDDTWSTTSSIATEGAINRLRWTARVQSRGERRLIATDRTSYFRGYSFDEELGDLIEELSSEGLALRDAELIDINNDGRVDLLGTTSGSAFESYLRRSVPSFAAEATEPVVAGSGTLDVRAGDFDGDTVPDAFVSQIGRGAQTLLPLRGRQRADRGLVSVERAGGSAALDRGALSGAPSNYVSVGRFDDTPGLDAVWRSGDSTGNTFFSSARDGVSLSFDEALVATSRSFAAEAISTGDFDRDGIDDVALGPFVFRVTRDAQNEPVLSEASPTAGLGFATLSAAGDLNADGIADLVISGGFDARAFLSTPEAVQPFSSECVLDGRGSVVNGLGIGDVDGDGTNEVLVGTSVGVDIFELGGCPSSPARTSGTSASLSALVGTADLNGDGVLDTLLREGSTRVVWVGSVAGLKPAGTFTRAGAISDALTGGVDFSDTNGDALPELFGINNSELVVFETLRIDDAVPWVLTLPSESVLSASARTLDFFGDAIETAVVWRPNLGLASSRESAADFVNDFTARFHAAQRAGTVADVTPLASGARAITLPYELQGFIRTSVLDEDSADRERRVSVDRNRGLVIDLPVYQDEQSAAETSQLRVIALTHDDFVREGGGDTGPLPSLSGRRSAFTRVESWRELPETDSDPTAGDPPHFRVVTNTDGQVVVRLFVRSNGLYRAYLEP